MEGVGTVTEDEEASGRYIVVKALEDGVVIMGLTRGKDTRSHHSERLEGVLAKHPGADDVVLHVVVGTREVVVNSDRYHVLAGPALIAEIDDVMGQSATRLEMLRPKAQSNGNGRGNGERGRRG